METTGSNYGSDRYGLVWGYVLGAGKEAVSIDSDGAATWLAGAGAAEPDRFVSASRCPSTSPPASSG